MRVSEGATFELVGAEDPQDVEADSLLATTDDLRRPPPSAQIRIEAEEHERLLGLDVANARLRRELRSAIAAVRSILAALERLLHD